MDFEVGGIQVAMLIFGVVEAAKQFGVNGRGSQGLALGLGLFFVGLSQAITQNLIPAEAVVWVELAVNALAGGLAAMGFYDFIKKRTVKKE